MTARSQQAGPSKTAPLWILAAAVLWGTTGTALALAPERAHPIAVGTLRLLIGGPLLLLFFRPFRRLVNAAIPGLLTASLAIAFYQPAFFLGVRTNGVAIGTLVAIGSAPLFAAALQVLLERHRPTVAWCLATFSTIAGLAILVQPSTDRPVHPLGIVASLGAGWAYALFVLATRRCIATGVPAHHVVAIAFTAAAVLLVPTLIWYSPVWVTTLRGLVIVLHLGIVATALAYVLFARGVSRTPAATTATLSLTEPLTASLLATLVLGEPFGTARVFGAILLLGGLAFLTLVDDPQTVFGVKRITFVDRLTVSRRR